MSSTQNGTVSSLGDSIATSVIGPSTWIARPIALVTVQITLSGTGQVDSVIDVEVSNGPATGPIPTDTPAATVTLTSAVGLSSDGFAIINPWRYIRFNVKSLSGAGASITGLVGA